MIDKGRDGPRPPLFQGDDAIIVDGRLVGVRRRSLWIPPEKSNSAYRVLIVEDCRDTACLLAYFLANIGFKVSTAFDGIAGLRAIKDGRPDLVILNYIMPGMDGLEVLAQVRRDPDIAHTKIIVNSASQIRDMALAMGAQGFIPAPIRPQELRELIHRVLRA